MMQDECVAQILFKPVCSKCGKVIEQRIDFITNVYPIDEIKFISDRTMITGKNYEIVPDKCPHCGAHFDMIALCGKLPFDGY